MKTIFMSVFALFFSFFMMPNQAKAQQAEELYYYYTDVNSNTTYTLYLKIMGYQTEVWTRSSVDNEWHKGTVTYSTERAITFTDTSSNTQYHIERDPSNDSAIKLLSSDRSKSWRYWEKN